MRSGARRCHRATPFRRSTRSRRAAPMGVSVGAGVLVLGWAAVAAAPPAQLSSIFDPASPPATEIYLLTLLVLGICAAIFVVVGGLIVYSIVAFRRGADDDGREPPQIYGSNPIEMAWTVVPLLIVFVLF